MKEMIFSEKNPLWYKDAVIYELNVRTFCDSNDDGIGDFKGLKSKLDYIEDLGVTAIWLLPFYPSPLKDDGYDISDYCNVNPDYGTLRDFREFLAAAKEKGLRVITELVLNHTSGEHAWFKRSRKAPEGSPLRDMYVWSDTPDKYRDARVIFKDFESSNWTRDPVSGKYFWHRFYSHQPDLNFDNPLVQKELLKVIDFWLEMGVDGLRLDAVPYLFEREGTNCENLPETHEFLKKLRSHVEGNYRDKMLLAEANQWPEDAARYFGDGDECHMAFHFPLMPRMFMSVQMEDSFPIIDILQSTPKVPDACQWAIFLRNHDELTLEMVTDEERDYLWRFYAKDPRAKINVGIRRRLAPLLGNNRRKIELMNQLLFSLPGTPVIYYGDEIGMGDNFYLGDRNGVRTPMQWSPDRNAGFSKANPHGLCLPVIIDSEYHYEALNVETQEKNLSSFLWWTRRVIAMRKKFKSITLGSMKVIQHGNTKVLAFIRQYENEIMLFIINLSRFSQVAEIDLSEFAGYIPEEVFSQNKFPVIEKKLYVLTMGPHNTFWLLLKKETATDAAAEDKGLPEISVKGKWESIFKGREKDNFLNKAIIPYIKRSRWFASKSKIVRRFRIADEFYFKKNNSFSVIFLVEMEYNEGVPETYVVPVSYCLQENFTVTASEFPQSMIAGVASADGKGVLYDGFYDEEFRSELLNITVRMKNISGENGVISGVRGERVKELMGEKGLSLTSTVLKTDQSNSSAVYEKNLIIKLYRKLGEGVNPEAEILKNLTEKGQFKNIPEYAGTLEYRAGKNSVYTLAMLQSYIETSSDAWKYTGTVLDSYFDHVLSKKTELAPPQQKEGSVKTEPAEALKPQPSIEELVGGMYVEMAALLGKRTAEMHMALAQNIDDPVFAPEPFSLLYQKSLHQSIYSQIRRTFGLLKKNIAKIPENLRAEAEEVLASEPALVSKLNMIVAKKISADKIRIHGDYHLGQVLYTGKDFIVIDFEGEPARALSERKLKQSPFKDVAGMIRSFHYAAYGTVLLKSSLRPGDAVYLEKWVDSWYKHVTGIFLDSYLMAADGAGFIPRQKDEVETLIRVFLIEKAVYELAYELNNRPDWVGIPLKGLKRIITGAGI
ncbi:MAG: maltose alpha-D-glucosyltransferase [Elusimicrobiota bacterium]